jgi:hypothetical protein
VAAFGQLVHRARFGDTNVGRGGQFQAAADHRAVQHGDHRDAGLVDLAEDAVPALRVQHGAGGFAVLVLGEVEPGAEVLAGAGQDHHAGLGGTRVPAPFRGRRAGGR